MATRGGDVATRGGQVATRGGEVATRGGQVTRPIARPEGAVRGDP